MTTAQAQGEAGPMKVLVTGGTGFVGKPLVRQMLGQGWQVDLVTRRAQNAETLIGPGLTVHEGDASDRDAILAIARAAGGLDAVVHMAASLDFYGEAEKLHRINVQGTGNLLELASECGARTFVYASSIEAQGPVRRGEVPAPPGGRCKPVGEYGRTKVLAEELVRGAARGRFSAVLLRIGNVYGPDHYSFMVEIAEAILMRNRLLEFLPAYADRYIHPVHVDDVAAGVMAACRCAGPLHTVTLGGQYATVGELFGICARALGRPITPRARRLRDDVFLRLRRSYHRHCGHMDFITYLMSGPGSRVHRAYCIGEAEEALGFVPARTLKSGIADTLQWAARAGLLECGA